MKFSTEYIELLKKHESQFVSLKYPSLYGQLKQIDLSMSNVSNDRFEIYDNQILLQPIENKIFLDPFRSLRTTSVLCENVESGCSIRSFMNELMTKEGDNCNLQHNALTLEISFYINNKNQTAVNDDKISCLYNADPHDIYSNLRSDIINILESVNIKTSYHYHGKRDAECVIGIKGDNIMDLADNYLIAKYIIENVAKNYGQEVAFCLNNNNYYTLIVKDYKDVLDQMNYNIKNNLHELQKYISGFSIDDVSATQNGERDVMNTGFCKIYFMTALRFNPYIILGMIMLCCSDNVLSFDKVLVNQSVNTYLNNNCR